MSDDDKKDDMSRTLERGHAPETWQPMELDQVQKFVDTNGEFINLTKAAVGCVDGRRRKKNKTLGSNQEAVQKFEAKEAKQEIIGFPGGVPGVAACLLRAIVRVETGEWKRDSGVSFSRDIVPLMNEFFEIISGHTDDHYQGELAFGGCKHCEGLHNDVAYALGRFTEEFQDFLRQPEKYSPGRVVVSKYTGPHVEQAVLFIHGEELSLPASAGDNSVFVIHEDADMALLRKFAKYVYGKLATKFMAAGISESDIEAQLEPAFLDHVMVTVPKVGADLRPWYEVFPNAADKTAVVKPREKS